MRKPATALLAVIVVVLGLMAYQNIRAAAVPNFGTVYQAVVLTGGQVYYGRLENAAGLYPVLRDVFYITTKENPDTKQVATILVRRGKELHRPEFMVLSRQSILFIEPVREDSEIAKSIVTQMKK